MSTTSRSGGILAFLAMVVVAAGGLLWQQISTGSLNATGYLIIAAAVLFIIMAVITIIGLIRLSIWATRIGVFIGALFLLYGVYRILDGTVWGHDLINTVVGAVASFVGVVALWVMSSAAREAKQS